MLSLVSIWGVRRLTKFMEKRLPKDHPVLSQLPRFLEHSVQCAELRMRRIGLLDRPLTELSGGTRAALVAEAYGGKALGLLGKLLMWPLKLLPFVGKKKRLTETYLEDPEIRSVGLLGPGAPAAEVATADEI